MTMLRHIEGLMFADCLKQERVKLLPHPPNTDTMQPDLAPCDFFLFPKIKKALAGKKYNRLEIYLGLFRQLLIVWSQEEYHKSFESWRKRLQTCIDVEGDYFEGLT
jgi:[histone H3]-lysine36 N-dimethyltransferase SETMAR